MFNQMQKGFASLAAMATLLALALLASPAMAAVDVTGVVTEIGGATAPIGLIGSAVLLVIVAIATFKWVRRAF